MKPNPCRPVVLVILIAVTALCALAVSTVRGAELDTLVARYDEARREYLARRKRSRKQALRATVAPILDRIGRLGTDESLAFLRREISSADVDLAAVCAAAALESGRAEAVDIVLRAAVGKRPAGKVKILEALATTKMDLAPAERSLAVALRKENELDARALLARALARVERRSAAMFIVRSARPVTGSDTAVKAARRYNRAAAEALHDVKSSETKQWIAGPALKVTAPEQLVVALGVVGAARLSAARPRVVELIGHRSSEVAMAATEALAALGLQEADSVRVVAACRRARKLDNYQKITFFDALARSPGDVGLDFLLDQAAGRDSAAATIAMASLALRRKSARALEGLLMGLAHRDRHVRNAALRSLGVFRSKVVVGPLIKRLEAERDEKLRIDALRLLVNLTDKNMGLVVADWRKWWEVAEPGFTVSAKPSGRTSVKVHSLEYFGIEITSKRIAFLVDASNSMLVSVRGKKDGGRGTNDKRNPAGDPGTKMAALKEELTRILGALPDDTFINIVYFHRSYYSWKKQLTLIKGKGRADAIRFVQDLRCGGRTNIYDTLEFALKDKRVDTIYMLSDGRPTGGTFTQPNDILREIGAINRLHGVTINTIGFGRPSDFLQRLAADSHGVHRAVGP